MTEEELADIESIPIKALKCELCEINSFESAEEYKEHLLKQTHTDVYQAIYMQKGYMLAMLKTDVKMSSARRSYKSNENKKSNKIGSKCPVCKLNVSTSLETHNGTLEHKVSLLLD